MEERELKRVKVKSLAFIGAFFGIVFGLVIGLVYGTVVFSAGIPVGGFPANIVGISGILGGLILGGIIGFVGGGIVALLYNFISDKIGGIKFELD